MKCSAVGSFTVGALLMIFATSGDVDAEPGRWYIGGGVGVNWTSQIDREGWNRETYCYPDSYDVPGLSENTPGVSIPGYRWMYALDMDAGTAFEISIGRIFNRWRLELSATHRQNAVDQKFTGINYLDGSPTIQPSSTNRVTSNSTARIDELKTRTLSLNAYYDFTDVFDRITPYLGVGLSVAFIEISGRRGLQSDRRHLIGCKADVFHYG